MSEKKRIIFYIDGFNFYFGIKRCAKGDKKWNNAYWIDMIKLCEGFLAPDEELIKVIYFTATPLGKGKSSRQSAFLNANKAINGKRFEIIRGKYLEKHIECPYCKGDISRPEEKKTDVNISVRMISDCISNEIDGLRLVTADTDLIPPLELIKHKFPKVKMKVCFPPSNYSYDISALLKTWKSKPVLMQKNYTKFKYSIMSDCVKNENKSYSIPKEWKLKQTSDIFTV